MDGLNVNIRLENNTRVRASLQDFTIANGEYTSGELSITPEPQHDSLESTDLGQPAESAVASGHSKAIQSYGENPLHGSFRVVFFGMGAFKAKFNYSVDEAEVIVDPEHGNIDAELPIQIKIDKQLVDQTLEGTITFLASTQSGHGPDKPFPDSEIEPEFIPFLNRAELTAEITEAGKNNLANALQPDSELQKSTRWMFVTVINETQFNLEFDDQWFHNGRFWKTPQTTYAFSQSAFSGCNSPVLLEALSLETPGVSGAALFHIDIPGEKHPIVVAFSNPFNLFTLPKLRAEFADDMKGVSERKVEDGLHKDEKHIGERKTKNGKKINVKFVLTSAPGKMATVALTQKVEDVASTP